MFSFFSLLASCAILFYVIRFRVHVHVTYTPTNSRYLRAGKTGRRAKSASSCLFEASTAKTLPVKGFVPVASKKPERNSGTAPGSEDAGAARVFDIASALVNLGASKAPARGAAERAVKEHPDASFDVQFSVALQEMRPAA